MSWRSYFLCASLLLYGAAPATFAADLSADVTRLFKLGAATGPQSKDVQAIFASLRERSPEDWRVHYAYSLVQLQQRRYPEAKEHLDLAAMQDDRDLSLRSAIVWVHLLQRDFAAALESATWTAQSVHSVEQNEDRQRAAVEFIGQAFGYLEGPCADELSAQSIWEHKTAVLKEIGPEHAMVFEDARLSTLARYESLEEEFEQESTEAKLESEKELERKRLIVEHEKDTAANDRLEIKDKAQFLQQELRELARLQEQLRIITEQRKQNEFKAVLVQAETEALKSEFRDLDDIPRNKPQARMSRIQNQILRNNIQLAALNKEAIALKMQSQALENKHQAIVTRQQFERGKLVQKAREVKQSRARTSALEKQLGKPKKVLNPAARALKSQIDSVTNYFEFPVDEEKARLVALFEERP